MDECTIDGCGRPLRARGWCASHYDRWRSSGDVRADIPIGKLFTKRRADRPVGYKIVDKSTGYIRIRVAEDDPFRSMGPSGWVLEHRYVMAVHLGRPLRDGETIHHLNGDKSDNRLENLELWTSMHPPGQRATELVKWAREVLELYGKVG